MAKIGRPKGAPNVKSLEALAVQQQVESELGGSADPLLFLLRVMLNDTKRLNVPETCIQQTQKGELIEKPFISMDLRIKAASAAVEYLRAKRKAVEVTGMLGHAKVDALSPKEIQNILTGDPFLNEPDRGTINVRSEVVQSNQQVTSGDKES